MDVVTKGTDGNEESVRGNTGIVIRSQDDVTLNAVVTFHTLTHLHHCYT
jgi:hypothetical protein